MTRLLRVLVINVALAAVYYLAARLGLSLAVINPSASPIWPATGIAMAAVLVIGYRAAPAIYLGALLANYKVSHIWPCAAVIAAGNTLEAVLTAFLVNQFAGGREFYERAANVFRFLFYAVICSAPLSAITGAIALVVWKMALPDDYARIFLTWWLGDSVGAVVITPLLVIWATRPSPRLSLAQTLEGFVLMAILVTIGWVQWGRWSLMGIKHYPVAYLMIPPLLWSALRFHQRGATTATFIIAVGAVWGTLEARGPFHLDDRNTSLVLLQLYAATMTVTALLVSTIVAERRGAEHREKAARREAETASRAKDDFLAVLSHELRTPLTPALLTITMLQRRGGLPEDVVEDLQLIQRNIELEARLIDDLLDLTRVARGKLQLNNEVLDIHGPLGRAVEISRRRNGVSLQFDLEAAIHPGEPFVVGDPARLQQVFWNLLSNAQKFTPPGGSIRIRSLNPRPGVVRVEVSDSGIGIEPEVLPRLFNAFDQGDVAAAKKAGGLGLGLAITKALVSAHGGELTASSAGKGQGATFAVELPTVPTPTSALMPPTPLAAPPAPTSPPVTVSMTATPPRAAAAAGAQPALNILLVEDDDFTSRAMSKLLARMGHRVKAAADVRSAMERVDDPTELFDLVISDVGLPDGSGHELMRSIRRLRDVPGIALSGYGMEEDIRKSRDAGFAEHLTKPVTLEKLESVIARVATGSGWPALSVEQTSKR